MPDVTTEPERDDAELTPAELELLRLRAERYAHRVETNKESVADVVIFMRGASPYAVPLESLREVRALRLLCRIPGAPRHVPGVIHSRGEIVSVHDIHAFLDGDSTPGAPWILIVDHQGERLGLMADEIVGVEPAPPAAVRATPLTMGSAAVCFDGVLRGEVLLLQPARLFSTPAFFSAF